MIPYTFLFLRICIKSGNIFPFHSFFDSREQQVLKQDLIHCVVVVVVVAIFIVFSSVYKL